MSDLTETDAETEGVDFAIVAYREEGVWQVADIAAAALTDVDRLSQELRRWPGDNGALGLVSVDEDFFLIVRVVGSQISLLLSDITAATDWPLARSVVDHLELPIPEDDDEQVPAGDLGIVADLGMVAMDMGVLVDDFDLYPDEMLSSVAMKLGFGHQFADLVGVAIP